MSGKARHFEKLSEFDSILSLFFHPIVSFLISRFSLIFVLMFLQQISYFTLSEL